MIANPDRIDQIEIIDGPAELIGEGRQLWGASKEMLAQSLKNKQRELAETDKASIKKASSRRKTAKAKDT